MRMGRLAPEADGLPAVVRAGDIVLVGACTASDGNGRAPADPVQQTELAFDVLEQRLAAAGGALTDVVGILSLHADVRQIPAAFAAARPRLGDEPPAWTPMVVSALPDPGAVVALSAIAHLGTGERLCLTPDTIAWWRSLPTSAGCRKGNAAVIAGQYGSDADGNVNTPGDHGGQARNALNRIKEIVGLLGGGPDDVAEILSFHQDPRGIAIAQAVAAAECFAGRPLPVWTAAGSPALYGFGMLGQYQAIADFSPPEEPGLRALAAEAPDARTAWDRVERALSAAEARPENVVAVTLLHKDVRALDEARAVVRTRCAPVWTAAAATGFARLESMCAIRVLLVGARI